MDVMRSAIKAEKDSAVMESETARELLQSLAVLGLEIPSSNFTPQLLFSKMKEKVMERLKDSSLSEEEPLLISRDNQLPKSLWYKLDDLDRVLHEDYKVRRKTLITRCDCTVQSFKWKESEKEQKSNHGEKIDTTYAELRKSLDPEPNINLAIALATRESGSFDLLNSVVSKSHQTCDIEAPKTTGMANVGKQQRISLQKFLIGQVPDRGGRPNEQPAIGKESFSQQQAQRNRGRGASRGFGQGRNREDNQHFRKQEGQHHGRHGGQKFHGSNYDRPDVPQCSGQQRGGDFDRYRTQQYSSNYASDDGYNSSYRGRGRGYQQHGGNNSYRGRSHY